jgi:N-sulfoglucosamine sulfohydrolase
MNKPNILYLHSHDTGRYIQPYGHAIATPHLQKLAEEGVLFRQNFCVNPTCSPSRAALLTGCYPHENGMTGLAHRGWSLNNYEQHIIHTLQEVGYTAVLTGVQHIASGVDKQHAAQTIGYDQYLDGEAHSQAASFLGQIPKKPFFLSVGFAETHREFPSLAESVDDPRYCLPPAPLPDTAETRQDMARFKASARILDDKIGVVLAALARSGLAKDTLVICTTDHGIPFPRMKCNLQDSGIGTLLIIHGPGGFSGGKVIDSMTSHLDIFPTICDLLDIEQPSWLRGHSLIPLVDGDAAALHDVLFFEVNYHAAYEPMRAVRTKRWKYIKRFDNRITAVLPNCDDGESKSVWLENGWRDTKIPQEALYDLMFDPNETNNLVFAETAQPVLNEMREKLERWMQETHDPLLSGAIQPPRGAVMNNQDGLSPTETPETAVLP